MKASPFSPLTTVSLLLGLAFSVFAQSGQYTVQIDSMTAQEAAQGKVQQLKAQGQNAYWLKSNVPGQGLRFRVRIGRFPSRAAALGFGNRLKQQGITSDFFVALFEGTSSPLGTNEAAKKPEAAPTPAAPKIAPPEIKTAENKPSLSPPPTAQRAREVSPNSAPANSPKPNVNAPPPSVTTKPVATPTPVPTNNVTPKPTTVTPAETKPLNSKPSISTPSDDAKAVREKKASVDPASTPTAPPNVVTEPAKTTPVVAANTKSSNPPVNAAPPPANPAVNGEAATAAAPANNYQRFEERSFGFSFEHPGYWSGGRLNAEDLQAQRIDAGAVFRSQEDVAFMNAIWNSLKNANSPAYDNNLIVDLVIKSLSSGTGLQGLSEISRRVVQEGDQIKTFVDLRTLFRQPRANQALEFQGKAVIIRANTGILLVVTFYSKEGAPSMIAAAERIIGSARVP